MPGAHVIAKPVTATAPASEWGAAPYRLTWLDDDVFAGTKALAFTPGALVVAGGRAPLEARALDTGTTVWSVETPAESLLVVDSRLLVATVSTRVLGLDATTGRTLWTSESGLAAFPPAARAQTVVAAAGSTVRAFRAADGAPLWQQELSSAVVLAPSLSDTRAVVVLEDRSLAGLDLTTGAVAWRAQMDVVPTTLTAATDRAFVTTDTGSLCALRYASPKIDWCWPVGIPSAGAPDVDGNNVFVAYLDNAVRVFDQKNGKMRAASALPARPAARGRLAGDAFAVPLFDGGAAFANGTPPFAVSRLVTVDKTLQPNLAGAAISDDGEHLALLTGSPGGRTLAVLARVKDSGGSLPGLMVPAPASRTP